MENIMRDMAMEEFNDEVEAKFGINMRTSNIK